MKTAGRAVASYSRLVAYHDSHGPVMAVNDVGSLAELQQKLQRRAREVREALEVIGLTVHGVAVEKLRGMLRVDEVHPQTCTNRVNSLKKGTIST